MRIEMSAKPKLPRLTAEHFAMTHEEFGDWLKAEGFQGLVRAHLWARYGNGRKRKGVT
jgi:hypothetical protein